MLLAEEPAEESGWTVNKMLLFLSLPISDEFKPKPVVYVLIKESCLVCDPASLKVNFFKFWGLVVAAEYGSKETLVEDAAY